MKKSDNLRTRLHYLFKQTNSVYYNMTALHTTIKIVKEIKTTFFFLSFKRTDILSSTSSSKSFLEQLASKGLDEDLGSVIAGSYRYFPCLVLRDKTASENIRCCCLYILFSNHMPNISFRIPISIPYISFVSSLSYTSKKDLLESFGFTLN